MSPSYLTTEALQVIMREHQKNALIAFKSLTGQPFNFIFEAAIKDYICGNAANIILPPEEENQTASKVRKRLHIRLTKETYDLLENYCKKNNRKMSPTAVQAAMIYIYKSL